MKTHESKPRQRTPLRRVSKKREIENRRYRTLRRIFLIAHRVCETGACSRAADDVHHKAGRGKNLNRVDTWLAVCRTCHDWIHAHPNEARTRGLLK